jgi:hypothetical protein
MYVGLQTYAPRPSPLTEEAYPVLQTLDSFKVQNDVKIPVNLTLTDTAQKTR